ncbi:MAG: hypothetical protein ACYTHM_06180 [Planctomycetota bacterium]
MAYVRFGFLPALAGCVLVILLSGCKSERRTTINQQVPGTSGGFPGTPLFQTNLASDGMAFSDSGFDFNAIRRFDNGRGEAIFLFTALRMPGMEQFLFASHFDGLTFTPPIELRGRNQDPQGSARLDEAFVAFLFPGGERDGDAVIGFLRRDLDDDGMTNTSVDPNVRLYFSYFDKTYRAVDPRVDDASIRHGFETDCPPLDLTDDDYLGADVALAGFLTDGTVGAAEFTPSGGPNRFRQGNTTTYLLFFWAQADSGTSPVRMHYATFDLTAANAGNQFGATAAVALDSGAAATDAVDPQSVNTADGVLLFRKTDGTDTILLASVFDTPAGAFPLNAFVISPIGANADIASLPGDGALFGKEAGLTRVVGVFEFTGGAMAGETSLYAFQIDPANPSAPFAPAADRVALDAGTGSTGPYSVLSGSASGHVKINRTGEWILVPWLQDQQESTPVQSLWVNVIQTPRDASPAPIASAVSGAVRVDQGGPGGPGVPAFQSQAEVGFGGFQSNRFMVNLAWQEDAAAGIDTLRFSSLTVTPGLPPTVARGSEGNIDFNDGTLVMSTVILADGGGVGGTPGAPILYYIRDARTSLPASLRAYQFRPGVGETEVGTLAGGPGGIYQLCEATQIRLLTTPRITDTVALPDWAGYLHHIFITEFRYLDSQGSQALRYRLYDKTSVATGAGDRFTPVADGVTPPLTLDAGMDQTPMWLGAGVDGDTVGIFFSQGDHIWYNEFSGVSRTWLPALALIDDRWPEPAVFPGVLFPYSTTTANDLHGAAVFWGKNFSGAGLVNRLFIRVRY